MLTRVAPPTLACFAPLFQMREVAPTTAGHIARLPSSVRRKVRLLVGARRLQKAHQLVHLHNGDGGKPLVPVPVAEPVQGPASQEPVSVPAPLAEAEVRRAAEQDPAPLAEAEVRRSAEQDPAAALSPHPSPHSNS